MTTSKTQQSGGLDQLQSLLTQLEPFHLGRPASASLSEYLRFLVDHDVLNERTAGLIEPLYHRGRYGGADLDEDLLGEAVSGLREAVDKLGRADPPLRARLADRLQARFPTPVTTHSFDDATQKERNRHRLDDAAPEAAGRSAGGNEREPSGDAAVDGHLGPGTTYAERIDQRQRPPRRRWPLLAGLLAAWTLIVLVVGYLAHPELEQLMARLSPQGDTATRSIENDRKRLSNVATEMRHARTLNMMGVVQSRKGEYAEAVSTFYQLLAHHPDDGPALNNLAWLMLTATDPWFRDPKTAKQLAEKAVAIRPHYSYLDTLAEACFQTGDRQQAIKLERQAIAKARRQIVPGSHREEERLQFLKDQLAKFERSPPAAPQSAAPRNTERNARANPPSLSETE